MLTGTILTVQSVFVPAEQRNKTMCVRCDYVHVTENESKREKKRERERLEERWDKRVAEERRDMMIRKQETGRTKRGGIRSNSAEEDT